MTAIAFAIQAFQVLPGLIAAGKDISVIVKESTDALRAMQAENRDPTQQEWDLLNARIAELRTDLHG